MFETLSTLIVFRVVSYFEQSSLTAVDSFFSDNGFMNLISSEKNLFKVPDL